MRRGMRILQPFGNRNRFVQLQFRERLSGPAAKIAIAQPRFDGRNERKTGSSLFRTARRASQDGVNRRKTSRKACVTLVGRVNVAASWSLGEFRVTVPPVELADIGNTMLAVDGGFWPCATG